jgi:hypothetical protein
MDVDAPAALAANARYLPPACPVRARQIFKT